MPIQAIEIRREIVSPGPGFGVLCSVTLALSGGCESNGENSPENGLCYWARTVREDRDALEALAQVGVASGA